MHSFLIFAALLVSPGAPPKDWLPLTGMPQVNYRWSRPTSDSCLVEFAVVGVATDTLQLQVNAKTLITRPAAPIEPMSGSPLHVEPTKIKPQTAPRAFSIQLQPHGRTVEDLHNCYGVMEVSAHKKGARPDPTAPPSPEADTQ